MTNFAKYCELKVFNKTLVTFLRQKYEEYDTIIFIKKKKKKCSREENQPTDIIILT